jgi:hypothetical protein
MDTGQPGSLMAGIKLWRAAACQTSAGAGQAWVQRQLELGTVIAHVPETDAEVADDRGGGDELQDQLVARWRPRVHAEA